MTSSVQSLWDAYMANRPTEAKRALVVQYLDVVRYVVARLGNLNQAAGGALEKEDLVQFGVLGLIDAIDRFRPEVGVKFETYAIPRVRGAILDAVRNLDWVPRSVRSSARRLEVATADVTQKMGREAADQEIAGRLAVTVEELQRILMDAGTVLVPVRNSPGSSAQDDSGPDQLCEEGPDPLEDLVARESKTLLAEAIRALPERFRQVIALYYYEELKFGEIGRMLNISESRVSQIHAEILRNLRNHLAGQA